MEIGAFKIDDLQKFSDVNFDSRLTFEYGMYQLCKNGWLIFIVGLTALY